MLADDSGASLRLEQPEAWDEVEERLAVAGIQARLFGEPLATLKVSRYELHERIAQGAMGVVYRAVDPLLGRDVAVKLIRARGRDAREAHARLLREAQAIAGVSHPNVIHVFDTGTFDAAAVLGEGDGEGVFMVLELVPGPTLHEWLAERRRKWREVLPPLLAAGRGLAAVHRAGLVHRDFKPANVLLGDPVRIADFGLAAASTDDAGEHVVAGTPGYMAPEQYEGRFDASSDQYAFGATLWHALHGRPLLGKRSDPRSPPTELDMRAPPNTSVPRWLHAVVVRAMHRDPEQRFPSMEALLAALDRDPMRRVTRVTGVVALAGLAGLGGFAAGRPADPRCVGDPLAQAWSPGARAAMSRQFAASGLELATDAFASLDAGVARFVGEWHEQRAETCGLGDGPARERTLACLERQRGRLVSLLDVFASADASMIVHTSTTVDTLPRPSECIVAEPAVTPRPAQSSSVERAVALFELGRNADARALALATLEGVEDLTLRAELEHLLCRIDGDEAAVTEALEHCRRSWLAAEQLGDADLAIRSLERQAYLRGQLGQLQQAWNDIALAEAKLETRPGPSRLHLQCGHTRASLTGYSDPHQAVVLMEQHLVEVEQLYGPDSTVAIPTLVLLALLLHDLGELERARAVYGRLLASIEGRLGSMHPHMAAVLNNAGALEHHAGDYPRALASLERALAIKRASPGWDTVRTASTLSNLAAVHDVLGEHATAEAEARAALAAFAGAPEGPSPAAAEAHMMLARVLRHRGETAAAHVEALAAMASVGTIDDVMRDTISVELARTSIELGEVDAARALLLEVHESRLATSDESPSLVEVWVGLALADAMQGRWEPAIDTFARAEALQRSIGLDPAGWAGECERFATAIDAVLPARAAELRAVARATWQEHAPDHPGLRRLTPELQRLAAEGGP